MAVIVLLLLLIPLRRLTRPTQPRAAVDQTQTQTVEVVPVQLELTTTRTPFQFEVRHLGHVVWSGETSENRARKEMAMEFPKEGIELELKGKWTGSTSVAAAKLTLTQGDGQPLEKSVWATGEFDEVLTFP